jgi:hypothetical protein
MGEVAGSAGRSGVFPNSRSPTAVIVISGFGGSDDGAAAGELTGATDWLGGAVVGSEAGGEVAGAAAGRRPEIIALLTTTTSARTAIATTLAMIARRRCAGI